MSRLEHLHHAVKTLADLIYRVRYVSAQASEPETEIIFILDLPQKKGNLVECKLHLASVIIKGRVDDIEGFGKSFCLRGIVKGYYMSRSHITVGVPVVKIRDCKPFSCRLVEDIRIFQTAAARNDFYPLLEENFLPIPTDDLVVGLTCKFHDSLIAPQQSAF